jgi:hypothetical protein
MELTFKTLKMGSRWVDGDSSAAIRKVTGLALIYGRNVVREGQSSLVSSSDGSAKVAAEKSEYITDFDHVDYFFF